MDKIDWGTPLSNLPVISRECFQRVGAEGFKLVIINGVVHDVSDFILEHPGGSKIMEPYLPFSFFLFSFSFYIVNVLSYFCLISILHFEWPRYCGKDATKAFTGGVYYHSNAARNALHQYRIGTIDKQDNWAFDEVSPSPSPSPSPLLLSLPSAPLTKNGIGSHSGRKGRLTFASFTQEVQLATRVIPPATLPPTN